MKIVSLNSEPMPPMSERAESILLTLKGIEQAVRSGAIRTLGVMMVTDTGGILTRWDLNDGDSMKVLAFALASDMITTREED